jgi:hypothetical protein
MNLDSITKIERYLSDALLASPLVPLGVNVVRLADVTDEEGILQMVNSMVVRYTGSSASVVQRAPLTLEYTMTFEVNVASQSYLSQSGHDFAVQLCTAARLTLLNTVPPNSGVEVVQPFVLTNEQFSGLTDSSHYTYTQQWQIVVQDLHRAIALDPCVQRGDCSRLFTRNVKTTVKPGQTVCGNAIYDPILPPPTSSIAYQAEYAGVELNADGDLVYKWDPSQIFMTAAELAAGYTRVCTGTQDESGQFEIINIHQPDGTFDRTFLAIDTGDRLLTLTEGMVRIGGDIYTPEENDNTEVGIVSGMPVTGYGQISTQQALIYSDPTNPDATAVKVLFGAVFPTADGTTLTHDGETYIRIGNTPVGRGWVKESEFRLFTPDEYLPRLDCDVDELDEGKIDSCD